MLAALVTGFAASTTVLVSGAVATATATGAAVVRVAWAAEGAGFVAGTTAVVALAAVAETAPVIEPRLPLATAVAGAERAEMRVTATTAP